MQQYRARGLAVVGLQETLEALANGQVEELLISGANRGDPAPTGRSGSHPKVKTSKSGNIPILDRTCQGSRCRFPQPISGPVLKSRLPRNQDWQSRLSHWL